MPSKLRWDKLLFVVTLMLVGLGIVMIYSASAIRAQEKFGDPAYFLKRQLIWAFLGLLVMFWMMGHDYRSLRRYAPILYLLSLFLLLLVLVPTVGIKVKGARRWLRLFSFSFQPSELGKFSLILFLAHLFSKKGEKVDGLWEGLLPPLVLTGLLFSLIVLEPHLGTAMIVALVALLMCFVAGVRVSHLILAGISLTPAVLLVAASFPHVKTRLWALLDPSRVSSQVRYQLNQSIYALGPGGLLGRGLGDSIQKLFYLPEPHTDFIFAIVGEEMGFLGASLVLFLFGVFLWRGVRTALGAPDLFGTYLAMGITGAIVAQAVVNVGMVVGLLPTAGLPLPFVSFGGSSLVISLMGVGILLNISQYVVPRGRLR
ncbi:MAG: putative lipid II flippase FtsW [candidate division NC10 bacterium]|nr:putative lipid II flippase FtsW [candidate division NC10 bacterium]